MVLDTWLNGSVFVAGLIVLAVAARRSDSVRQTLLQLFLPRRYAAKSPPEETAPEHEEHMIKQLVASARSAKGNGHDRREPVSTQVLIRVRAETASTVR